MKYSDDLERSNKDKVFVIRTQREMLESEAYKNGNWETVAENIAPALGDGGANLYAIHAEDVRVGEWTYNESGDYAAERVE